jgi:hypothetical protein
LFLRQDATVKPILQALLLADHVYTDSVTGKKIVAGIFHSVFIRRDLPEELKKALEGAEVKVRVRASGYQAGSPFCYVSMTEVRGEQHFQLRFVDLADESALLEGGFAATSTNPLDTIEIIIPLPTLPITKTGNYALELLWNSEPLGVHRLKVVEAPEAPNEEGNANHGA